jgi:EpsI family protein
MNRARITSTVVCVAMVMAAARAHFGRPTVYMTDILGKPDLETLFPAQFAEWRIDERSAIVVPSPDTQALLDSIYNQTLARTYVNQSGDRVMLSVAYGGDQSDGTRAHVPEACYPAQGFQITANARDTLTLGGRMVPVRHLMSQRGARQEPLTYWLLVGDQVTVSRTEQKLAQLRLGLKGLIPDGMLVRVSSIDSDKNRGHKLQHVFLSEMALALPESARSRVLGAPNGAAALTQANTKR